MKLVQKKFKKVPVVLNGLYLNIVDISCQKNESTAYSRRDYVANKIFELVDFIFRNLF